MKNYAFVIASKGDVGDIDLTRLVDLYNEDHQDVYSYCFEAPDGCDDHFVTLIGMGHAFRAGWDPEVSICVTLPAGP